MNGHRHQGGERYVVELEAMADDVPPIPRLRQFLKSALRTWKFRARSVTESTPALPPLPALPAAEAEQGGRRTGETAADDDGN